MPRRVAFPLFFVCGIGQLPYSFKSFPHGDAFHAPPNSGPPLSPFSCTIYFLFKRSEDLYRPAVSVVPMVLFTDGSAFGTFFSLFFIRPPLYAIQTQL